jgi:cytochrome c-type biogenesis protein CcmH
MFFDALKRPAPPQAAGLRPHGRPPRLFGADSGGAVGVLRLAAQTPAGAGSPARRFCAALALAVLLALSPARAEIGDTSYRLADPVMEQRAREIGKELRCLVCQNQSIEDSDASLARDLRKIVREQLERGASDAEVMSFVHSRYGDFVLLRPPVKLATLLLWATPLLALLGGGFALWRSRRRMPATIGPTELSAAERARLAELESPRHP